MSLAIEKILVPAPGHSTIDVEAEQKLDISVVFTTVDATLAALKEACNLASNLGARITLVVPQVVAYPVPLQTPPVLVEFNENRFRVLASNSPVETSVKIYLCRDRLETLLQVLSPGTIVVLGGQKRRWPWWLTKDERLARRLRLTGYEVLYKEVVSKKKDAQCSIYST